MQLKRIGVLSVAKIAGILYGGIGLIIGAIITLASVVGFAASAGANEEGALVGLLFGTGAIIVLPLFYGIIGMIGASIGALIYNFAAGIVGGIELELE